MLLNKNKKGAVSLFTGIAVLFVSIIFLGIFTYFAMGYFGGLEDSQIMKTNKNNLSQLNELIIELKESGIGSYKEINLDLSDPITIDSIESKIYIRQEIKNQKSIENLKTETTIGALNIRKQETSLVYTLDYNGKVIFNNTFDIMPGDEKLRFTIVGYNNNIPVISIERNNETLFFESVFDNKINVTNNHANKDIILVGYVIESSVLNTPTLNNIIYFQEPITIGKKESQEVDIACFPENNFLIKFITNDGKEIYKNVFNNNNYNLLNCIDYNILGFWKIDDGNQITVKDYSQNNNDGIIYGTPQWIEGHFRNYSNKNIVLDGNDDYINLGNTADNNFTNTSNFSINVWVKKNGTPETGNVMGIIGKANKYGIDYYFLGNQIRAGIRNSIDGANIVEYTVDKNLTEWTNITMVYESEKTNGLRLYINGDLKITRTTVGLSDFSSTVNLTAGDSTSVIGGTPKKLIGNISNIRLYNRVLTNEEITEIYLRTKNNYQPIFNTSIVSPSQNEIFSLQDKVNLKAEVYNPDGNYICSWNSSKDGNITEDGLVLWYRFLEGDGNIVYDHTKNKNDGNIISGTWTNNTHNNLNYSLYFNGATDYVIFPKITLEDKFSFISWGYYAGNQSGFSGFLNRLNGVNFQRNRILVSNTQLYFQSIVNGVSTDFLFTIPSQQHLNQWKQFGLVYDGNNVKGYFQGNQIGTTQSLTGNLGSGSSLGHMGWGADSNDYHFKGNISELRLYNIPLSANDINQRYNNYTNCDINVSTLSLGNHTITLTVTDQNQTLQQTRNISVLIPTTIAILSPTQASTHTTGSSISFTSQVNNPVGAHSCSWTSSIDGNLSSECNFSTTTLTAGNHTITLGVTDENETKTKSISLTVNQPLFTTIAILSPTQASTHLTGSSISFTSQVNNPVGAHSCSWTSSIDGNLSSECNFSTTTLTAGNHTITLSVTDQNQTLQQTRNISVLIPTTIAILSPTQASTHLTGSSISFTSQVNNPVGAHSCSWTSSIDGNLIISKTPYTEWNFNETTGTTVYDYRNNINGTMYNVTKVADRFGRENNALSFNGTTSYIDFGNVLNMGLNNMSFSTWVKTNNNPGGFHFYLSKSIAAAQHYRYGFETTTVPRVLTAWNSDSHVTYTGTSIVNNNNWNNIIYVYDRNSDLKIYVNGVLDSSHNISSYSQINMLSNNPFKIGAYTAADNSSPTLGYTGSLDDFKVYYDVLSSEDINKIYKNEYSLNNCDINASSLSPGNHTITLYVTDQNQTLQQTRNISVNNLYLEASGGTITTSGDYRYHTFTSNGTLNVTTLGNGLVDVLVVGGGGGAGRGGTNTARNAGGGGAGGLIYIENYTVSLGSISVTIGAGGAGSTNATVVGSNGQNTLFGSLTALGGGGGGSMGGADSTTNSQRTGQNGGSGGGSGVYGTTLFGISQGTGTQPSQSGLSGTNGFGNNGSQSTSNTAGGGGGAGGESTGTAGGAGMLIWGNTYAVGGNAHSDAAAGTINRGNGGNAAATNLATNGGNGGSGIVIVRYKYQN